MVVNFVAIVRQTTSHGEVPEEWEWADVSQPLETGLESLPDDSAGGVLWVRARYTNPSAITSVADAADASDTTAAAAATTANTAINTAAAATKAADAADASDTTAAEAADASDTTAAEAADASDTTAADAATAAADTTAHPEAQEPASGPGHPQRSYPPRQELPPNDPNRPAIPRGATPQRVGGATPQRPIDPAIPRGATPQRDATPDSHNHTTDHQGSPPPPPPRPGFISMLQKCRLGIPFTPDEVDLLMNHHSITTNAMKLFSTREEVHVAVSPLPVF
ncbi:hypothetical protein B0T24DRAFT_685234 [Lasiosphaeria ovina]|uniref:Uncharacterized protein n=1 Tax=Lasiosphaeria ovina TaxID=92902 RepID=A0AAE0JS34_9PEZI|nr:hypothetical protein B0T24DRAFT_685234 [Lasiosphaeria ovina]